MFFIGIKEINTKVRRTAQKDTIMQDETEASIEEGEALALHTAPLDAAPPYQPLTYDPALYADDLKDNPHLTEAQRAEILKALWVVICCFVDLDIPIPGAAGRGPESCGQRAGDGAGGADPGGDVLSSKDHSPRKSFQHAGQDIRPADKEGS